MQASEYTMGPPGPLYQKLSAESGCGSMDLGLAMTHWPAAEISIIGTTHPHTTLQPLTMSAVYMKSTGVLPSRGRSLEEHLRARFSERRRKDGFSGYSF